MNGCVVKSVEKVVAYITNHGRLLVFSQPGSPEAGIQVPAGTLKGQEDPEAAVLREAEEETGLSGFSLVARLGTRDYDLRGITGEDVLVRRHYFHLRYRGESPSSWSQMESDPSGGFEGPIIFRLFWVDYPEEVPDLSGRLGDLLHRLPKDA